MEFSYRLDLVLLLFFLFISSFLFQCYRYIWEKTLILSFVLPTQRFELYNACKGDMCRIYKDGPTGVQCSTSCQVGLRFPIMTTSACVINT